MPSAPSPCPFCGHRLKESYSRDRQTIVGYYHEAREGPLCIMGGQHIGAARMDLWEKQQGRNLRMKIVGDKPVFGYSEGRVVDVGMINASIEYYRSLAERKTDA